jgi:hypothetical protein
MHLILVGPDDHLIVSTALIVHEDWDERATSLRLQLGTQADSGVIIEFLDPEALRVLAVAARSLLVNYNAFVSPGRRLPIPPRPPAPISVPTPLSFGA